MVNPMMALLNRAAPQQAQRTAPTAMKTNPMHMIREFNKFRQIMRGRDPQQILNRLIETGEMTPEQLEEYKSMAQDLLSILK